MLASEATAGEAIVEADIIDGTKRRLVACVVVDADEGKAGEL